MRLVPRASGAALLSPLDVHARAALSVRTHLWAVCAAYGDVLAGVSSLSAAAVTCATTGSHLVILVRPLGPCEFIADLADAFLLRITVRVVPPAES